MLSVTGRVSIIYDKTFDCFWFKLFLLIPQYDRASSLQSIQLPTSCISWTYPIMAWSFDMFPKVFHASLQRTHVCLGLICIFIFTKSKHCNWIDTPYSKRACRLKIKIIYKKIYILVIDIYHLALPIGSQAFGFGVLHGPAVACL